ncbi:MAG: SCO7613 C-terminal domain-containing membrane protein, partial [Acidimicrobiales bacterium]
GAGGATLLLARRGLRASAEAVGVVSAALALATFEGARDVLFTGVDPWLAWAFGCGVVALALIGLGHVARVRAPMIVAVILGQWCVPLVLAGSTPALVVVALAALWVAVADVLVATATTSRQPEVSALAGAFGVVAWLTSVLVGTALLFDRPGQAIIPLLLAALAAAAVSVSSHPAFRRWWAVAAAGATASTVLAMVGVVLALGAGDAFWLPVAIIAGGVAVWLPTRSDDRLVAVAAVAGASAVLVAAAELARSIAAAAGPYFSDSWVRLGWSATGGDVVALGESSGFMSEGDPTLTFLGLVAATGLLVRWPRVAVAAGALTVAAAGGLLDLSVVAVVVVEVSLAVGFCLGFALDRRIPGEAGLIGLFFGVLATGWAHVVAPELVLGVLIVMLAAAVAAVVAAVEGSTVAASRRESVLIGGVGAAWLTGLGSALSFGVVMGWAPTTVWLFTAVAAMVGSLAGFVLDDRSAAAVVLSDFSAVAGIAVAGVAAAAFGDAHTLSLLLAGVTVTALAHTLRPDRFWPAAIIATGAGVSLVWLRLWMIDIEVVEAYALPLAAALGLLGWLVHRRGRAGGSWAITGPALLVATVPST